MNTLIFISCHFIDSLIETDYTLALPEFPTLHATPLISISIAPIRIRIHVNEYDVSCQL